MRISGIVTLFFAHLTSVAAQSPIGYGVELAAGRFGLVVINAYEGTLEFSSTSGPNSYSASATLRNGLVHCTATERDTDGTFTASGPGLIDISLGIPPDRENPAARPGGKLYIIRVACPHPRSPPPHEARWSEEWSTYKQQGGEYDSERTATGAIIVHKFPDQLRGSWSAPSDEESRSMTWNLCLRGFACPGSQL